VTHKILKSSILPYPGPLETAQLAFSSLVNKHIDELRVWNEHDLKARAAPPLPAKPKWRDFHKAPVITAKMTEAEQQTANLSANKVATDRWAAAHNAWQKQMLERHEPYPRPVAHRDIDAAVAETINADGSTTFAPDFEIVNDDPSPESVLAEKKLTLLHKIAVAEAAALEKSQLPMGKRRSANLREAAINAADGALWLEIAKGMKPEEFEKFDRNSELAKRRDPADTQHLADQEARREAADAILHKAAQAMSDVEDLTLDNIDNYQLPDFG
jgi:hypothetical protein